MTMSRTKSKGRQGNKPFVQLTRDMLNSSEFHELSAIASKMLMYLLGQYNGFNNGDLSATWSQLQEAGWKSKDTCNRATYELLEYGWIIKTRQGGKNRCNLYAITFYPIDECKGKHDTSATRIASNEWNKSLTRLSGQVNPNIVLMRQKSNRS